MNTSSFLHVLALPYIGGELAITASYKIGEDNKFILHGRCARFHPNGMLASEGTFKDGQEHGVWTDYMPFEMVAATGTYKNGVKLDDWEYNLENTKEICRSWKEHLPKKAGGRLGTDIIEITFLYENRNEDGNLYITGARKCKEDVTGWVKHGYFKSFHPNGNLADEGLFLDNVKHGLWRYHSENGDATYQEIYEHGEFVREPKSD